VIRSGRADSSFRSLLAKRRHPMVTNVAARAGALVSLALATLVVARIGGPAAVGAYALLRILPGIVGLVIASGLPGAAPYFLAGATGPNARLRGTVIVLAGVSGVVGTALWVLSTPLLQAVFFPGVAPAVVALAGLTVLTQLLFATSKACLQGLDDLPGTNWAILLEEFLFLPAYLALYAANMRGAGLIVVGLLIADVVPTILSSARLARRGFFDGLGRPALSVAKTVSGFGARGQVGNLLSLLNYRLDFVILGAMAGPAVLGGYAVASKLSELLRLISLSFFWVLYPRFAKDNPAQAEARARRLIPRAALLTAVGAVPLALTAGFIVPAVYGEAFRPAILPAQILLVGLSVEGIAGVISAFLYGRGRPGLNSLAMGAGVVVTVALDLLLIPPFGAVGAAWASSAAYLTTTAMLIAWFATLSRRRRQPQADRRERAVPRAGARPVSVRLRLLALAGLGRRGVGERQAQER
jgi:O-antigen/teichoic acid export membrane protein